MYERGRGVPQDDVQAAIWYRKAMDQGDERAKISLIQLENPVRAALVEARAAGIANSSTQTRLLNRLVKLDSEAWAFNRYVDGSMKNVTVLDQAKDGSRTTFQGYYAYADGKTGSVKAQIFKDKLPCVEFWDFPGDCRQVRVPAFDQRLRDAEIQVTRKQEAAAWAALPDDEKQRRLEADQKRQQIAAARQQQCAARCSSVESSCHSGNFDRGAMIMGMNGINMSSLLMGGIAADDCSAQLRSCVSRCEASGN
jgi:hypothetical protein